VVGLSGIDDITAGESHTCAIDGGTTYCWGSNANYQLGLPTTGNYPFPMSVSMVTTATAIDAGTLHTCAKLSDGNVVCWGARLDFRSGGTSSSGSTATPITVSGGAELASVVAGGVHTCALATGGDIRCWGDAATLANGFTSDTGTPTDLLW
jgi:alpha-tubulin suppressor-like RCC1 family protein